MVWIDPEYDCFVILLTNRVYPYREQRGLYEFNIRPRLLNYAIKDEINQRYIIFEGFAFAPSVGKRDYMFELEAIAKSIQIK